VGKDREDLNDKRPRSEAAEREPSRDRVVFGVAGMGGSAGVLETFGQLFFRQLAAYQKDKAIGIVVSGTGSDDVLGMNLRAHARNSFSCDKTNSPCTSGEYRRREFRGTIQVFATDISDNNHERKRRCGFGTAASE